MLDITVKKVLCIGNNEFEKGDTVTIEMASFKIYIGQLVDFNTKKITLLVDGAKYYLFNDYVMSIKVVE